MKMSGSRYALPLVGFVLNLSSCSILSMLPFRSACALSRHGGGSLSVWWLSVGVRGFGMDVTPAGEAAAISAPSRLLWFIEIVLATVEACVGASDASSAELSVWKLLKQDTSSSYLGWKSTSSSILIDSFISFSALLFCSPRTAPRVSHGVWARGAWTVTV